MSDALLQALAMPLEERKRRWNALMQDVQQQDVMWWLHRFTSALARIDGSKEPARTAD
jgi:trehalose 6-phosphate synthase